MNLSPNDKNTDNMWSLLRILFPIYRALLGPGFKNSLNIIKERLNITINEFPTGTKVFDWVIPKEFKVNSSFVIGPDGNKMLDFNDCHYHVWGYSQPYKEIMKKDDLIKKISTHHLLNDAIPLRVSYYRKAWGLCASKNQVKQLKDGDYKIYIDTEHFDGALRIGEYYLPGENRQEILIASYLCHPLGANDNLSGVVLGIELFNLLKQLPNRRYSYRLVIWPETIGSITYIYHYPDRIKHTIGGYLLLCLGDDETGLFHYAPSFDKGSLIDRTMLHSLKQLKFQHRILPGTSIYSDERQFNGCGVRLPFGCLMRTPPGKFSTYHTSKDDLDYIKPEILGKSLQVYWKTIMTMEKNKIYKGNFTVEPFLNRYGIYPYDLGIGEGTTKEKGPYEEKCGFAYYYLMHNVNGKDDLLTVADNDELDIDMFDRPVNEFLAKDLIKVINN